jgi:Zn-dependent protease
MPAHDTVPLIQHAIQLSIAPVFLLTGIAALLGVMANRLARIIDRARDLDRRWKELDQAGIARARREVIGLERRRRYASWAINFCTSAALLVCLVIVTLFLEEFVRTDLTWLAGAQFVAAMISLIGGLAYFLAEVYIATHSSRIDAAHIGVEEKTDIATARQVDS